MRRRDGFTVIELLVATSLMLALTAGMFAAMQASPDAVAVQTEVADMHQRIRIAANALLRDLMTASSVRPYRWGATSADPPGTVTADTITSVGEATTTYWLKSDDAAATYQLMSYSGGASPDVPVADNVVALRFDYFGDPRSSASPCVALPDPGPVVALEPPQFADGPWCPDAADTSRWDADLLRVRVVVVSLRVQAALAALRGPAGALFAHAGTSRAARRWAPDVEVRFQVAPRNLNLRS